MGRSSKHKKRPGTSGKEHRKGSWINFSRLKEQREFLRERARSSAQDQALSGFESGGRGHNLVGRSDLSEEHEKKTFESQAEPSTDNKLYESIKIALQRSPEVNLAEVNISVRGQDVTIHGKVAGVQDKRTVEAIIRNVPRVREVFNLLETDSPQSSFSEQMIY